MANLICAEFHLIKLCSTHQKISWLRLVFVWSINKFSIFKCIQAWIIMRTICLETEMPGCTVVFFGFATLDSISFGTKLFKYLVACRQARNTELRKIFTFFTEVLLNKRLFFGLTILEKGWSILRAVGIKFSVVRIFIYSVPVWFQLFTTSWQHDWS